MPVEVVRGRSIEEIRLEWSQKWGCHPEELELEILEKPSFLSRQWKVQVSFSDELNEQTLEQQDSPLLGVIDNLSQTDLESVDSDSDNVETVTLIRWEENRYIIEPGDGVRRIIPCHVGEVFHNGALKENPFIPEKGDVVEFRPYSEPGQLNWVLEVRHQGLSVIAKVKHTKSGTYALPDKLSTFSILDLAKHSEWRDLPPDENYWDEARLDMDLEQLRVVYGKLPKHGRRF